MASSTKLETVIDLDILELILECFFAGWEGSYYVMPADAPDLRLLENPDRLSPFCSQIRSIETGARLCHQHDLKLAQEAFEQKGSTTTLCHAGLLGFVIPIFVDSEPLATIFFGQGRSWLQEEETEGKSRAIETASDLGLERQEILELRERSPRYSEQQFNDIKTKLARIANYVSDLGHEKNKARATKQALQMQLHVTEATRRVATKIIENAQDLSIFWRKVGEALAEICEIIGAQYSLFVTYEMQPNGRRLPIVQAVGNLKWEDFVGNVYPKNDPLLRQIIENATAAQPPWKQVAFDAHSEKGTICYDIGIHRRVDTLPDRAILLPVDLGDDTQGILIFLLGEQEDIEDSLTVEQEIEILTSIVPQIALAYQNHVLYAQRQSLASLRRVWLENVAHQLVAPLTSIEGHAERLYHRFNLWVTREPHLIESTIQTILASSKMAARLARNFAWMATDQDDLGPLELVQEIDLVGLLVAAARNVQGLAAKRGLHRVHIDQSSLKPLNRKVKLDRRLFSQAISNLLDNAVKYADKGTEVIISGKIEPADQKGYICVTNIGIPITEEEVERVFEREYRAPAAIKRYAIGTGIGLPIARDIIRLHNGKLTTRPSTPVNGGFETTFTIELPLLA